MPWYYPQARPDVRMCSPYEAREFDAKMEDDSANCTVNKVTRRIEEEVVRTIS